jgi:hypothetical protein
MSGPEVRLHLRSDREFERVVFAEVLVPDVPNTFGDYWTAGKIREAAYAFAERGYGIDLEHDKVDRTGGVHVVESFIARAGDPTFIEGSWVAAMRIHDDVVWEGILSGEINGYSYEALVSFLPAIFTYEESGVRAGVTEADLDDGHTHEFLVIVDEVGRTVSGGTSTANGHSHIISRTTVTDESAGHFHRFNIVKGAGGI